MTNRHILDFLGLPFNFLEKEYWQQAQKNNFSVTYQMTSLQLYKLDDLSTIQHDLENLKRRLTRISHEDLQALQNEILKCLIPLNEFGFLSGDFGRSFNRMQLTLDVVRDFDPARNKKICELGTNSGAWTFMHFLHKDAIVPQNYTGCDLVPEFCQLLTIFGVDMYMCNLAKDKVMDIMPTGHDMIILTEVLEHMENEEVGINLLLASLTLLNKDGRILISYPTTVGECCTMEEDPLGHHYQPDINRINQIMENKFESTQMLSDGARVYHYCKGYEHHD